MMSQTPMTQSAMRLSVVLPRVTTRSPIISLSSRCLRQQCRFYASKPKPTRKTPAPVTRIAHTPPIAPVRPRQAQTPAAVATVAPTRTSNDAYVNPTDLFTHTLAQRTSPTLLYLAPTSSVFPISSLSVSAFALSYGFYHLYDALLVVHPGL